MYMKNYESIPVAEVEFEGLKKDGKFWFPHIMKYFAWFLLVASIITSSVILIYYGMSFGMIKTYLWMTAVIGMVIQAIFLTAPVRIMVLSFIKGVCLKSQIVLIKRLVSLSSLSNPDNPQKKNQVLKFRKYHAHLYKPVPLYKLQTRIQEAKYNIELRNLTVDIITHVFFMITVFYVVLINKTPLGYFSTDVIENLVVRGSYTNSIPFTNVTTYDTLLEYLNKTLLPALLINYRDYKRMYAVFDEGPYDGRRNRREVLSPADLPEDDINWKLFDERKVSQQEFYQRGWTMEPAVKLIGKPRIRQVRVKGGDKLQLQFGDSCVQYEEIESRNVECAAELTILNVERENFSLRWEPWPPKGLTPEQEEPWIYRSGWETKTVPIFAKFSNYPFGGYVLNFGKNINDSRIILKFLDEFQWIDVKTRGVKRLVGGPLNVGYSFLFRYRARSCGGAILAASVFIEFTTYCVNTNVFNVVTLIAEKSATGYIIPSFKIETCEFLFLSGELQVFSFIMIGLFSTLLFFFLLRETIRMHRTSIWPYFRRTFAILDLSIVLLGVLSLVFIILRDSYVSQLLKELELSDNNEFVSFIHAAFWHMVSVYIEAFLVCLASFKVFRLLIFRVIFFQLQTTLSHCCKQFVDLVLQIFILTIGFALFFYLCLNAYTYCFSNFPLSVSTMIGRSVLLDDTFDFTIFNSSPWYLAPVFFAVFIVVITILFMNLFIAVICLYFSSVRKISFVDKYSISRYVKHVLVSERTGDLLGIRGEVSSDKSNPKLLRLKGGGSRASKRKAQKVKKNRREKRKRMIHDEEDLPQTYLRDFVKERLYELIIFQSLPEERDLAMKYLTVATLTDREDVRRCAREKALLAYFTAITSGRRPIMKRRRKEQFILVAKKCDKEVINRKRLFEMKKTVEEYGKQKGWIINGGPDKEWDSAESLKNDLCALNKKIDDLFNKCSKINNVS